MKIKVFALAAALVSMCAANAHAITLSLEGINANLRANSSEALYASDGSGNSVLVTSVGASAPSGEAFSEIGVPSMMPDGRVLFGAETASKDRKAHWGIYFGNPDNPPLDRVRQAVEIKPNADCAPLLNGDPYPVADAEGTIAFISHLPDKSDALVLYSGGKMTCLARSGIKTNEGHEIALLSFGSPQMGDTGEVIFNAWLEGGTSNEPSPHRQALLMASQARGIRELAVEGDVGPNNTRYQRPFGLPSAVSSPHGTLAAFTARTPTGAALFLYGNGAMSRILPTGVVTPLGPVSYLSPGRPGLMADGTTAVLAGCARIPAIFKLSRERLDVTMQRGQVTPFGTELESLGDPVLTGSGAMFIGATDSEEHEKLYVLEGDGGFHEVGMPEIIYRIATSSHRHSIFTGTLAVNQHGDFAYLGGR
ncbi:MAG TPA: hypothetical protein VEC38_12610 [Candidatus Binataceae bacterium]|nr:hypothetical protein [Candidatus Binataceae bacterium]